MSNITAEQITSGLQSQSRLEIRHAIQHLHDLMASMPQVFDEECVDFPVKHYKAPGMIGREMFIPKGSIIIGKIHKHSHLNIVSVGHVRVLTEAGQVEIIAPHTFTSEVGARRLVVAMEDTIWTTLHLNPNDYDPENKDDMEKLEAEIIAPDYQALESFTKMLEV